MEKKEIEITLGEISDLDVEINGMTDPSNGTKVISGILDEKMSIKGKFWVTQLADSIVTDIENIKKCRIDLIQKYGKLVDGGMLTIAQTTTNEAGVEVINQNYVDFVREYSDFLNEKKTIEYIPIKLDYIGDIQTSSKNNVLFKFIEA